MQAPQHWHRRTIASWLWWPVSYIYYAALTARSRRVTPVALDIPVICVGNNLAGGAGKTPVVMALCDWLIEEGYHPHVISRGYGGNHQGVVRVDPDAHQANEVGDEPLLIARHAPCWVAKRRLDAARAAMQAGANVIVMDDGLQNPSLIKTCSLLVIDGSYGFGSALMIPAGPCREPIATSMAKSDAVIMMGEETNTAIRPHIPDDMPVFSAKLIPVGNPVAAKRIHPFAGIGHPQKFFDMLQQMGATIVRSSAFADHHPYSAQDCERLQQLAAQDDAMLVTTHKDMVRIPNNSRQNIIAIDVDLQLSNKDVFMQLINQHVRAI